MLSLMKAVKFATQTDAQVAQELRAYAAEADRSICGIVNEAVAEYLKRRRVRPAFRAALDEVLSDHEQLLGRLAK